MAMAACGSFQHIFENPVPENPTLLESLSSSWNQIKAAPIDQSSFTASSFPSSPFSSTSIIALNSQNSTFNLSRNDTLNENDEKNNISSSSASSSEFFSITQKIESFSLKSESLKLCTEGLGFESSDDVEDMKNERKEDWQREEMKSSSSINNTAKHARKKDNLHATRTDNLFGEFKKSRSSSSFARFPPPISCIGKSGKPCVCFKSYREDGRFVLKEVRIPSQELLHACREDGRLKLQFVLPKDEVLEEENDEVKELEEGLINGDTDEGEKKKQA